MHQTTHFFNLGYGWLCKHCSAEDAERQQRNQRQNHHGERKMTNLALAKWLDEERHGLTCPRCGIEELVTRI
jgi:hypothetical protein